MQIEKGIPIYGTDTIASLLSKMEAGDSFLIPEADFSKTSGLHGAQQRALFAARRMKVKVKTRKWDGGLRVWRVE